MTDLGERIEALRAEQIVEVAISILSPRLGIDDPETAAESLAHSAHLEHGQADELTLLARQAATQDLPLVVDLLTAALSAYAEQGPEQARRVAEAVESAGDKQLVIGIEHLLLGVLILSGWMTIRPPDAEVHETVELKELPDGGKELKYHRVRKKVNPLGALTTIIGKLLPGR